MVALKELVIFLLLPRDGLANGPLGEAKERSMTAHLVIERKKGQGGNGEWVEQLRRIVVCGGGFRVIKVVEINVVALVIANVPVHHIFCLLLWYGAECRPGRVEQFQNCVFCLGNC